MTVTYIVSVVVVYFIVSISMVYLNKVLLSNPETSIPAPIFIAFCQCSITSLICVILGIMGETTRYYKQVSFLNEFPLINFSYTVMISILPLSLTFVGMIIFNNICLQYVEVSFYNVARSLSIVFNVIFTYLIMGKSTSLVVCCTLLVVIIGFYVGIDGEINFSLLGTMSGVLSSVFVSLNSILTVAASPKVCNHKSLLLFYNNINASLLFIPIIFLFEIHIIIQHLPILLSFTFWTRMIFTGLMGFAIGFVSVMQLKATSPLTHNISGTAKAAVQSLLAFYIWDNKATLKSVLGIFLVIFGSGLYTGVQMLQSSPKVE